MPSLAIARSENKANNLSRPVAVLVGGTGGIGAAIALKFAQYSTEPELHIVGRNESAAQAVIDQLKAINSKGTYHFHKSDLTLISSVRQLTSSLRSSIPQITHLILSPGVLDLGGRDETVEGNDYKMMLHYYSRFLVLRELLPNLSEDARVLTVLDGTSGDPNKINWDDIELKEGLSWGTVAAHCSALNDMMMDRLGKLHPSKTFVHAFPSLVQTSIFDGLPWYLRWLAKFVMNFVAAAPENCAEWLFHAFTSSSKKNVRFVDNHGDDAKDKVHGTEEQIERAWRHSEQLVDKVQL